MRIYEIKKIMCMFLILIVLFGTYSLAAQGEGDTIPTPTPTAGTTTSGATTDLKDFTQTVGSEATSIGNKVVVGANAEDVIVKNADVKKTGEKTDFTLKDGALLELKGDKVADPNKIDNLKKPVIGNNDAVINEKGRVIKTDLTIGDKKDASGKPIGQDLDIKKIKFNAPEGSRVQFNEGEKIIKVDLKAGTQISKVPSKREAKTGDDEEQGKVQYRSPNGYVKLPDSVATSLGFNSLEFKGILSTNGDNWLIDSGKDVRWKIDGKESVFSPNIHDKIAKADENLKVFFGDFDKTKVNGAYIDFAKDSIRWGSTSANEAHPLSILKDNPWGVNVGDKGFLGGVPFEKSEFYIKKDAATGKSSFGLLGSGLVGDDYSTYKFEELANGKVDIRFKEGISMQGLGVSGKPTNVQTDILPFKADGTAYLTKGNKLIIGTGEASNFKILPMSASEKDVGKVMLGQKPVESTGTPVIPAVPSVREGPPQFNIPAGNTAQANAVSSTVRIVGRDPDGLMSVGTGTIIGIKGNNAYVITCAHLFRENQGRIPLQIDLFDSNANKVKQVIGTVVNYDLSNNDIALVRIPVSSGMVTSKVAPQGYVPRIGENIFSVGCGSGSNPVCRSGQIVAINKYSYWENMLTRELPNPEEGRSGGGVFTTDGKLIGVLSARDEPTGGLYGNIKLIQSYLDRLGLSGLYQLIIVIRFK